MSLTAAAEAMVREIRALSKWEHELIADLGTTRTRLAELTASAQTLVRLLPGGERSALGAEIARILMPLVRTRRRAAVMTEKVAAVHEFLAASEGEVAASAVQHMLMQRKLTTDPSAAHSILARKVRQGMVERLSRGLYRVNPNNNEIVVRRFRTEFARERGWKE